MWKYSLNILIKNPTGGTDTIRDWIFRLIVKKVTLLAMVHARFMIYVNIPCVSWDWFTGLFLPPSDTLNSNRRIVTGLYRRWENCRSYISPCEFNVLEKCNKPGIYVSKSVAAVRIYWFITAIQNKPDLLIIGLSWFIHECNTSWLNRGVTRT